MLVVTLLMQGLGRDSFRVLQHALRDLYRAVRLMNGMKKDETVLCHVGLALVEIMRSFLTPPPAGPARRTGRRWRSCGRRLESVSPLNPNPDREKVVYLVYLA